MAVTYRWIRTSFGIRGSVAMGSLGIAYSLGSDHYLLSNRIPNWSSLVAYRFASVIKLFQSRSKQYTRDKNGTKPTSVVHRLRKHVETEQPIHIQVVQQSPPNVCIRTVGITASRPLHSRWIVLIREYNETCPKSVTSCLCPR